VKNKNVFNLFRNDIKSNTLVTVLSFLLINFPALIYYNYSRTIKSYILFQLLVALTIVIISVNTYLRKENKDFFKKSNHKIIYVRSCGIVILFLIFLTFTSAAFIFR